jgi:5'-methylthioadenosine phosphorylase
MRHRLGVIGGSGLYALDGLTDRREVVVETPFGAPSAPLVVATLGETELVFLPRHGRHHHLLPQEVPYAANLWALKAVGVDWVLSVSAVGSLREDLAPGEAVLVDQFVDRTWGRRSTFFGEGVVGHAAMGDPTCGVLRRLLRQAVDRVGQVRAQEGGTYVCIQGPAFSTRAESELFRSWGASVVGMTNVPEAKLAREAGLSYATLALVTDFDCWHPHHDDVTVEAVLAVLRKNTAFAQEVVRALALELEAHDAPSPQRGGFRRALMTPREALDERAVQRLAPLLEEGG